MPYLRAARGHKPAALRKTPVKRVHAAVVAMLECRFMDLRLGVVGGIGGGDNLALPLLNVGKQPRDRLAAG